MRKRSYFEEFIGSGWPAPSELEHYFLAPPHQRWRFRSRNDCWGLKAEGVDGTEHLSEGNGRIDLDLTILGNPDIGVLFHYLKWRRGYRESYYSKGDMTRLHEWVRTKDGDAMPVGLYVPFEEAWKAVKEFIEKDGALPTSIAWVDDDDLPGDAFPDPTAPAPDAQ